MIERSIRSASQEVRNHIDEKVADLNERIDALKEQVTRTNGRVTKNERFIYMMSGGLMVITVIVIPLVVYIWNQTATQKTAIENAIRDSLLSQVEVVGIGNTK